VKGGGKDGSREGNSFLKPGRGGRPYLGQGRGHSKGVVIDAWVRVSLVGIELLAVEARVVAASVETFLKYAEAVGLLAEA